MTMTHPTASLLTPTPLPVSRNDPISELDRDTETGVDLNRHDGWLVSFIDILILLITLFVLLLTYQQDAQVLMDERAQTPVQHEAQATAASAPAINTVQIPVLSAEPATPADTIETESKPVAASPVAARTPGAATSDVGTEDQQSAAWTASAPTKSDGDQTPEPSTAVGFGNSTAAPAERHGPLPQAVTENNHARRPRPAPLQLLLDALSNSELQDRIEVHSQGSAINLEISDSILFPPASAALSPSGSALLETLADTLSEQPYALSVEGHTDNLPIQTTRFPSNWELSSARASTVARHLIKRGVAAKRIRTIGYASTRPRAQNRTPEGRSKNRRVTLVLQLPAGRAGGL